MQSEPASALHECTPSTTNSQAMPSSDISPQGHGTTMPVILKKTRVVSPDVSATGGNPIHSKENASGADVSEPKLDEFLMNAVNNPRDRLTLFKLEQELDQFLKDSSVTRLEYPPMSSYQRLIVHRVAQYFNLEHRSLETNGGRGIVLFKSPESRAPAVRFSEMAQNASKSSSLKKVKILSRQKTPYPNTSQNSDGQGKPSQDRGPILLQPQPMQPCSLQVKSLEEREEEYAKARARIFSDANEEQEDGTVISPSPDISEPGAPVNATPTTSAPNNSNQRRHNQNQNQKHGREQKYKKKEQGGQPRRGSPSEKVYQSAPEMRYFSQGNDYLYTDVDYGYDQTRTWSPEGMMWPQQPTMWISDTQSPYYSPWEMQALQSPQGIYYDNGEYVEHPYNWNRYSPYAGSQVSPSPPPISPEAAGNGYRMQLPTEVDISRLTMEVRENPSDEEPRPIQQQPGDLENNNSVESLSTRTDSPQSNEMNLPEEVQSSRTPQNPDSISQSAPPNHQFYVQPSHMQYHPQFHNNSLSMQSVQVPQHQYYNHHPQYPPQMLPQQAYRAPSPNLMTESTPEEIQRPSSADSNRPLANVKEIANEQPRWPSQLPHAQPYGFVPQYPSNPQAPMPGFVATPFRPHPQYVAYAGRGYTSEYDRPPPKSKQLFDPNA